MADLVFTRNGATCADSSGATGRRGTLALGDRSWYAIERDDGYKWLRPGTYSCEMGYVTFHAGQQVQAIRVLGDYSHGRIYIHPANRPSQLAGCIAPGTTETDDGVGGSRDAMSDIFNGLGGFRAGASVSLEVAGLAT
jgi:hypothetical protein